MSEDNWMTEAELAELVGVQPDTLRRLRYERKVYPFYKVPGTRTVRYKRDEINAILEAGRIEVRA